MPPLSDLALASCPTAKEKINSGAKIARTQVRKYRVVFSVLDEFRGGTSEWMTVQVQANMVVKQAHTISHVERLFPSNCQLTRAVELEAEECPTKSREESRISMRCRAVHG